MANMGKSFLWVVDDGQGLFGPLTDLRSVFELRTGCATTRLRLEHLFSQACSALTVPVHLEAVVRARYQCPVNHPPEEGSGNSGLVVNGRWTGSVEAKAVQQLKMNHLLRQADGQWLAARVDRQTAMTAASRGFAWPASLDEIKLNENVLIERPWHILDQLGQAFIQDGGLIDLPLWSGRDKGVLVRDAYPFKVGKDATLLPGVMVDTSGGPIYVNERAVIESAVVLQGPCYIGSGSVVKSHSTIRPYTVVGPMCKVGGELSASIIHGHSNKAHDGFLGDSLVGQWVNLGAGTTVSNLKNTYTNVRVQLGSTGASEDTGRLFCGPVIGDFVRTAIGSRLITGSCIGTGAMLALSHFAPKYVKPFGWYTDSGVDRYDISKFEETARAMMARRKAKPDDAEVALWRKLYHA